MRHDYMVTDKTEIYDLFVMLNLILWDINKLFMNKYNMISFQSCQLTRALFG